jgi:hypothetical protein
MGRGADSVRLPLHRAAVLQRGAILMSYSGVIPVRSTPVAPSGRDLRLDFFRGLALFFIFIDHIPGNIVADYTVRNFGFSDASEIFIFISGYAAGLVYLRAARREGIVFASARVLRRVWQLYVAHLFLFVIFVAQVAWTSIKFDNPMYVEEMNIASFLQEPHIAIIESLLLKFKPVYMDILPLYIVLLLFFPIALWLSMRSRLLTILVSAAFYAVVRYYHFNLPGYPPGAGWFFNPLAWQLLFVTGAVLGGSSRREPFPVPRHPVLLGIAVAYLLFALVASIRWNFMDLGDGPFDELLKQLFPFDKTNLSLWRFSHFLALAYTVIYFVRPENRFFRTSAAGPVILCGQHSLHVFCLGVFLSFAGLIAIVEVDNSIPFQLLVNATGVALMIGTAWVLEWYRAKERDARRLVESPAVAAQQPVVAPPVAKQQALGGSSAE